MPKYFTKGWEDAQKEREKLDQLGQLRKERAHATFWLKEGEEARIIFIDSEPFNIYEHKLQVGNRYDSFLCTKEWEVCPICQAFPKSRPSFVNYFTIIDTRSYIGADGKEYKNVRKLFGAKGAMQKMLFDIAKKKGGLTGLACKVKRYSATSPSSGDFIEVLGKVKDLKTVVTNKQDLVPYDYEKIFAPLTPEELQMLGINNPVILGKEDVVSEDDIFTDEKEPEAGEIDADEIFK